ncbi:hypothetical protein QBC39DRAFT_327106 [Podospora conica]|nr:hypothetical protein QBC39DRAFT_327106 [Schizothecium conicum]
MILRFLPLLSLLLPLTLAHASARPSLGNWMMDNLTIACHGDPRSDIACWLNFDLLQDTASESKHCSVQWVSPTNQPVVYDGCNNIGPVQITYTNVTLDDLGVLWVIVPSDTRLRAYATFSYYIHAYIEGLYTAQLQQAFYIDRDDGPSAGTTPTVPDQTTTASVAMVATAGATMTEPARARIHPRAVAGPQNSAPKGELVPRGPKDSWRIMTLRREYDEEKKGMLFSFRIEEGLDEGKTGTIANCLMSLPGIDGKTSWFRRDCGTFGYSISWGYKKDTDGAVMTVCNVATGKDAFFGFDDINDPNIYSIDSPWEPTHISGCK